VVSRRSRQPSDFSSPLGSNLGGTSPDGPRGRRMLSADTPVESLDNYAPRGTYLDILV
jgi:hypothetical protein